MSPDLGYPDNLPEMRKRLRECELAMFDLIEFPPKKLGFYVRAAGYLSSYKPRAEKPEEADPMTEAASYPNLDSPLFGRWLNACADAFRRRLSN